MSEPMPRFIRRTLGYRTPSSFSYDRLVPLRGRPPVFLLTHPQDVRYVLVENSANYVKTPFLSGKRGRRRVGQGLITRSGTAHRDRRRHLQPLFHPDWVLRFEAAIHDRTMRMLMRWESMGRFELASEMADLTLTILLTVLFGEELDDESLKRLVRAIRVRRRYTEFVYYGRGPFREMLPVRVVREHRHAIRVLDAFIFEAIRRRRSERWSSVDLVGDLIRAESRDGSRLSDADVRDEVLTFTSTGYETLGEALAWAFHLIGHHPQIEANLYAELTNVLEGRDPMAADLEGLPEVEKILAETMRLYPPTWIFSRIPVAEDRLPVGGPIPSGSTLYICQYLLHRHPRHFADSERFDPDRFANGTRPPRFVYLPFGDGPHRCIGEHLARLEAALVLALIAQRSRIIPRGPAKVRLQGGITLRPGRKLMVDFERRG